MLREPIDDQHLLQPVLRKIPLRKNFGLFAQGGFRNPARLIRHIGRSPAAFTSAGAACCADWHPARESATIQDSVPTTARSLRILIVSQRTIGLGTPA